MKLLYLTALDYPSTSANSGQVKSMARAFRARLGNDFCLIINRCLTRDNIVELNPIVIGCNWKRFRTVFYFFWLIFHLPRLTVGMNGKVVVYCKDPNLCLILIALKPFFLYQISFEAHLTFRPLKNKIIWTYANYIICTTSFLCSEILSSSRRDRVKTTVEPDAVDLSVFDIPTQCLDARRQLGLPTDLKILGYTGNFTTFGCDKGIAIIIHALTLLTNQKIHFWAVGGSQTDISTYQLMAQKLKVDSRVHLLPHCRQDTLAVYQKAFDVLLMPFPANHHYSYYMSPLKMFEYMASKTPIIASDLPSIREILNEENSFLSEPGNSHKLAATIELALFDHGLAEKKAIRAYKDVRNHTWDKRACAILATVLGLN